jgi:hypothetical protein
MRGLIGKAYENPAMPDNHYLAAERELAAAINDSTLVDDLPLEEANTYAGRQARYRATVAMAAAQVHAMLALVDAYTAGAPTAPSTVELTARLEERCVRAVGTFCEVHNTSHWQADRAGVR